MAMMIPPPQSASILRPIEKRIDWPSYPMRESQSGNQEDSVYHDTGIRSLAENEKLLLKESSAPYPHVPVPSAQIRSALLVLHLNMRVVICRSTCLLLYVMTRIHSAKFTDHWIYKFIF
ncbi:hypothetical protein ACET3Z_013976 [Daucus carota]